MLTCADYGDPTSRRRLFIRARRRELGRIHWPAATHAPRNSQLQLFDLPAWCSAREIIDWTNLGSSIFRRKRPLRPRTLERIETGIRRFCGEPFLVILKGQSKVRSIRLPVPTVTAHARHLALASPFLIPYYGTGVPRSIDQPLGTVTAKDRFALVTADRGTRDIYFRMLQPRELARAQGFPDKFAFSGTKHDQVTQIGNAVPVHTGEHLCHSILEGAAA